jgi:hypothetical protein
VAVGTAEDAAQATNFVVGVPGLDRESTYADRLFSRVYYASEICIEKSNLINGVSPMQIS